MPSSTAKREEGFRKKKQKKKESLVGVRYNINANIRTAEEVTDNPVYPEKIKNENEKSKALSKKFKNESLNKEIKVSDFEESLKPTFVIDEKDKKRWEEDFQKRKDGHL